MLQFHGVGVLKPLETKAVDNTDKNTKLMVLSN